MWVFIEWYISFPKNRDPFSILLTNLNIIVTGRQLDGIFTVGLSFHRIFSPKNVFSRAPSIYPAIVLLIFDLGTRGNL